jgi:hypothetical protein
MMSTILALPLAALLSIAGPAHGPLAARKAVAHPHTSAGKAKSKKTGGMSSTLGEGGSATKKTPRKSKKPRKAKKAPKKAAGSKKSPTTVRGR